MRREYVRTGSPGGRLQPPGTAKAPPLAGGADRDGSGYIGRAGLGGTS